MPSTVDQTTGSSASDVTAGMVWTNITQPAAAELARKMYEEKNGTFQSDLINSYAWYTAIVFLQTYSGDTDYSVQTSTSRNFITKTGEKNDDTTDKKCNIYDMSDNAVEWITQMCTFTLTEEMKNDYGIHHAPCCNMGRCNAAFVMWREGLEHPSRVILFVMTLR